MTCKTCGKEKPIRAAGQCGGCFWEAADKRRISSVLAEANRPTSGRRTLGGRRTYVTDLFAGGV